MLNNNNKIRIYNIPALKGYFSFRRSLAVRNLSKSCVLRRALIKSTCAW